MYPVYYYICCALCILQASAALGQPGRGNRGQPAASSTVAADTSIVKFVTPGTLYTPSEVQPDASLAQFYQFDPTRVNTFGVAQLGNQGSAHRDMFFREQYIKGLDFGYRQYDRYKFDFENFKFYDANPAFSRFRYVQGASQQDGIMAVTLGKSFAKGIKLSLNYLRINHEGEYWNQRNKNTAFGIGIWYEAPGGKYDGLYLYHSNSIVAQDNGGVSDYTLFEEDLFNLLINIPVHLRNAMTTHRQRTFTMQHHLHLIAKDRTERRAGLDLIQTTIYEAPFVKFVDENATNAADYYDAFLLDPRGVRTFIQRRTWKNAIGMQFRYHSETTDSLERADQFLYVGLEHRNHSLNQEPERSVLNELFLNARLQLTVGRFLLNSSGYLSVWDQGGDFLLAGDLQTDLGAIGRLTVGLHIYQRTPYLTERKLYVNQQLAFQRDFSSYQSSRLSAEYAIPSIRFEAGAMLYRLQNYIYYNAERLPEQIAGGTALFQLTLKKDFRLGPFGLNNIVAVQSYSEERLALPKLILQHQLFFESRIFRKRLKYQLGADFRMTDQHAGVSYFPVTGQFYLNDARLIPQYPALDVYLSFQVKTFKAFFKFENLTDAFRDDLFYQVVDYPQFGQFFRFGLGITWYE